MVDNHLPLFEFIEEDMEEGRERTERKRGRESVTMMK